jgi:NAD(P)-dependent dehydrogenase (short-subunit alcohol dehydrogenase family)
MDPNDVLIVGQVALVTGAASGMGLATAKHFAEAGAVVVLADMNAASLSVAIEQLATAVHKVISVRCNVADEAFERRIHEFGSSRLIGASCRLQFAAGALMFVSHRALLVSCGQA